MLFYNTWTKRAKIHTYTNRSGVLWFEESLSLALFCNLVTLNGGRSQAAYRSIHQFPATIEICLVYLLFSCSDRWSVVFLVLPCGRCFPPVSSVRSLSKCLSSLDGQPDGKAVGERDHSTISDDAKVLQAARSFVSQSFNRLDSVHPLEASPNQMVPVGRSTAPHGFLWTQT